MADGGDVPAPAAPAAAPPADKGEERGAAFQKEGEDSLWNGPVKKRCCTDIVCVPIFFAHILAFWFLTFQNAGTGDPMKLIRPRDYRGQYCGIGPDGQWESTADLKDMKKLMWSMNMDEAFDVVAKGLACSNVGYSTLVDPGLSLAGIDPANKIDKDTWTKYCGKTGSALKDALTTLQKNVSNTIEAFTDPKKAFKLYTSAGNKLGPSMLKEMTKYYNMVCTTSCKITGESAVARKYTYSPAAMKIWGKDPKFRALGLWSKFINEVEKKQPDLINSFKFNAWSLANCPYPEKLCVAMPGMEFQEVSDWGMCHPKISSDVMSNVGAQTAESLEGLGLLSITEDVKGSFGDTMGDLLKTYDVFIIVGVLSLVLGIVVLLVMRFVLTPFVWTSLLLVFLILAGGGVALIVRAQQCAEQSFQDAANSQSSGDLGGALSVECLGGWSIENQDARNATKVAGFVVLAIAGLWALGVICMFCRIRLAIAINQVACQFIYSNPQVILVPIIQNVIGILWIFLWCFCASFLLSQVADDVVPSKTFATYAEAWGTNEDQGACTNSWPSGDVYVDELAATCTVDSPLCYKCSAPRFTFDWKFGYSFLSFLWHNFFIVAVGQCTIAGAVGIWFFGQKGLRQWTVCPSLKNALFYHTGSLAFGSLILAIVVWLKWFMEFLARQAKAQKNKVMMMVFRCLGYCLWCFEKCVKFLNKNAYIQVALMGTNFCKSAKAAFFLIVRNALRFGVIVILSHIVHFIGMVLITAATAVCGYFILQAMHKDVNPIVPTICYAFIGWMTAKVFIGVFGLAVDATLQCFIAAEEMDAGNDFAPGPLKAFIDEKEKEGQQSKACDGCCCTIL